MALRLKGPPSPTVMELFLLLKLEFMVMSSVVFSPAALMLMSVLEPLPSFNDIQCSIDCCFVLYKNILVFVSIGFVVGTLLSDTSRYYSYRMCWTRCFTKNLWSRMANQSSIWQGMPNQLSTLLLKWPDVSICRLFLSMAWSKAFLCGCSRITRRSFLMLRLALPTPHPIEPYSLLLSITDLVLSY